MEQIGTRVETVLKDVPGTRSVFAERTGSAVYIPVQQRRYAAGWNRLLTVVSPPCQKPSKTFMLRSGEVETVEVHHFVPHRHEVVQELLLGVLTSIDFRQGPELGVRTEDQVDTGAGPLECAR
jgi:hypothetical protein